jgi:hypothetical protein
MTDTPVPVTVHVVDATRVHADGTTCAAGEQLQVTDPRPIRAGTPSQNSAFRQWREL